jgi:hypothetical protein
LEGKLKIMAKTLKQVTEDLMKEVDWIGGSEKEALETSLILLAEDYDTDRRASQYAQYGLMLRYLMSLKPKVEESDFDALDALLKRDSAGESVSMSDLQR